MVYENYIGVKHFKNDDKKIVEKLYTNIKIITAKFFLHGR